MIGGSTVRDQRIPKTRSFGASRHSDVVPGPQDPSFGSLEGRIARPSRRFVRPMAQPSQQLAEDERASRGRGRGLPRSLSNTIDGRSSSSSAQVKAFLPLAGSEGCKWRLHTRSGPRRSAPGKCALFAMVCLAWMQPAAACAGIHEQCGSGSQPPSPPPPEPPPPCPPRPEPPPDQLCVMGWSELNGKCSQRFGLEASARMSWQEAENACVTQNAHLASVASVLELQKLATFCFDGLSSTSINGDTDCAVGLHRTTPSTGDWIWTDGSVLTGEIQAEVQSALQKNARLNEMHIEGHCKPKQEPSNRSDTFVQDPTRILTRSTVCRHRFRRRHDRARGRLRRRRGALPVRVQHGRTTSRALAPLHSRPQPDLQRGICTCVR